MMRNSREESNPSATTAAGQKYESPTVTDHGSLAELTLSGTGPLSDAFGNASSGAS